MDTLPWVEKYRPTKLSDIISHKEIINILLNLSKSNKIPNMILYGPPGTGKTSTIMAFAKELYKNRYKNMILELNCSDDRGINIVREQIKNFSSTSSNILNILNEEDNDLSKIKLVILDEADALTDDAQYALRRVLEIYANTTRFCFICNYITKLIPALHSRCQLFRFGSIKREDHLKKLNIIEKKENIIIDIEAKNKIIDISEGDLRKSLNLFQAISMSNVNNNITLDIVYKIIGYPSVEKLKELINIFDNKNLINIYEKLNYIQNEYNLSNNDIIKELTEYFINKCKNKKKLIKIIDNLANIEINLSNNTNNNIHLMALSSIICQMNN